MANKSGQGRPPKPTALRLIQGNPGKRPINKSEPKPKPSVPRCPAFLNRLARAEWHRVCRTLVALGLVTQIDRSALAAYCVSFARWSQAEVDLLAMAAQDPTTHGTMLQTKAGHPIQNPMVNVANRAMADMCRYGADFGMNPSARSRIQIGESGDDGGDNPWSRTAPKPVS